MWRAGRGVVCSGVCLSHNVIIVSGPGLGSLTENKYLVDVFIFWENL